MMNKDFIMIQMGSLHNLLEIKDIMMMDMGMNMMVKLFF